MVRQLRSKGNNSTFEFPNLFVYIEQINFSMCSVNCEQVVWSYCNDTVLHPASQCRIRYIYRRGGNAGGKTKIRDPTPLRFCFSNAVLPLFGPMLAQKPHLHELTRIQCSTVKPHKSLSNNSLAHIVKRKTARPIAAGEIRAPMLRAGCKRHARSVPEGHNTFNFIEYQ